MAKVHGKNVVIFVADSDGTEQNLKGDGNNVTLNLIGETADTRSFGETFITRIAGIKDWGLEYAGFFNSTGSTVDATLASIYGTATSMEVYFGGCPVGAGSPRYRSSVALCTNYSVTGPVEGPINVSFSLVGGSDINRTIV